MAGLFPFDSFPKRTQRPLTPITADTAGSGKHDPRRDNLRVDPLRNSSVNHLGTQRPYRFHLPRDAMFKIPCDLLILSDWSLYNF